MCKNKVENTQNIYKDFLMPILDKDSLLFFDLQIELNKCHYLIDLDVPRSTQREPRYAELEDEWEVLISLPFLDAER